MGPLGISEIAIIVVLALILFGPEKLPELTRTLGKALGQFRRASNELRYTLDNEMRELERHVEEKNAQQAAASSTPAEAPAHTLPAGDPAPIPEDSVLPSASGLNAEAQPGQEPAEVKAPSTDGQHNSD